MIWDHDNSFENRDFVRSNHEVPLYNIVIVIFHLS